MRNDDRTGVFHCVYLVYSRAKVSYFRSEVDHDLSKRAKSHLQLQLRLLCSAKCKAARLGEVLLLVYYYDWHG